MPVCTFLQRALPVPIPVGFGPGRESGTATGLNRRRVRRRHAREDADATLTSAPAIDTPQRRNSIRGDHSPGFPDQPHGFGRSLRLRVSGRWANEQCSLMGNKICSAQAYGSPQARHSSSSLNLTRMATHTAAWIPSKHAALEVGPAETPTPGPGELLVKVKFIAFSPIESKLQA